jgi:FxsC-like protein
VHESGRQQDPRHAPYFFLSYAHTPRYDSAVADPDMWVERLYRDLCDHVMAITNHPAGYPVGFMDREIRSGEGWPDRLAEALATARVFVPLFSPRYFDRPQCGREWYAFAQRAHQQYARGHRAAEAIVPALWVPVEPDELPSVASRLQFNHSAFGENYTSEGLCGLIKLKFFREDYERAVWELAKRIVNVAKASGIAPGPPVDYHRTPSAFGARRRGPRNLRITVVAGTRDDRPDGRSPEYYGDTPLDWNPYHPASVRPLARFTEDLVQNLDYVSTVSSFDDEPDPADDKTPPVGPELMLLDRWALHDDRRRKRLARSDAVHRPWVGVIVPWNRADPETADAGPALAGQMEETIPNRMAQGRLACRAAVNGIHSLQDFGGVLPEVVEWAAAQYLKHAPARPPGGPAQERPRLVGPVPGDPPPPRPPGGATGTDARDSSDDPEDQ